MNRQLRDLRMAVVMDDFSFAGFAPDCHSLALTANNWLHQVMHFWPQLLLVESAWWGAEKSWHRMVSEAEPELRASCVVQTASHTHGVLEQGRPGSL
ncbi:MAG: hypothetical protein K9K38_11435 [Rhodoferax sp.]|nr:hypothetical protein [Rhodoferax sp.]